MEKLGLNQIREEFLSFFQEKQHLRMDSFPLVPINDNSLLLINAGMAPLKKYFTGEETPPSKRVTTCQKCIRTPDIERVGITARHGTFFEMLGNFSFGDYFKKEITAWAWEFITKRLGLPEDKLWVSVYTDDDEAYDIWTKDVGVSPDRMVRFGKEDNFWEIGQGPCGPCSEIYFDRGEEHGCHSKDCKIGCDCDRYVEFWNLVFTQFDKDKDGNYSPLAHPNIDTGMGLERIAAIMQDVHSLFEVDTVRCILDEVCTLCNKKYGIDHKTDISIRVVTDHIRSTVFLVSDGVIPSNEGRGYVLRRLLRRAARHGKLLGINKMFLTDLAQVVISQSKDAYPDLLENKDYIMKIISVEEKKFYKTIDAGIIMLNDIVSEMKKTNNKVFDGEVAFKLHDTYGFPFDLTKEILEENSLEVSYDKYKNAMEKQRLQSQAARGDTSSLGWESEIAKILKTLPNCEFVGYDSLNCESTIIAILKDGEQVENIQESQSAMIVTDKTPFYGESGGQIGDTGEISANLCLLEVIDTKKYSDGKIAHSVIAKKGILSVGDKVKMSVSVGDRMSISRNHSATHLLQKALKTVLGNHVNQAGSYVTKERLRFDFSHFSPMTDEEILEVQNLVNDAILNAYPITCEYMSIDEAKKTGAMALFGEKYGLDVRVVSMGDYSKEFCGGTHLTNTSQVGLFKILSESGVAAGVRRIEAVTGKNFLDYVMKREELILTTAKLLKINNVTDFVPKVNDFVEDMKNKNNEIENLKQKLSQSSIGDIINNAKEINNIKIFTAYIKDAMSDDLKMTCDTIKEKFKDTPVVIALSGSNEDKITFVASATKEAVSLGIHCGKIIKAMSAVAGGSGGGKPDMAQGGGKDFGKIQTALDISYEIVKNQIATF